MFGFGSKLIGYIGRAFAFGRFRAGALSGAGAGGLALARNLVLT